MKANNLIEEKSFKFALRIVNLYKFLQTQKKEYIMSKQILRSGTSVGANIAEGVEAQSKKDFISKMSIALKEANETKYWLRLLIASDYIDSNVGGNLKEELLEIIKILTAILKKSRENLK
ncbi:four helix bundle protein [Psychrilyobacter atlanticus]|uniref:four helix bundle protein n=1 Tax=Psychrilyobacter atlanticus TaxID=271091 RepID=UPI000409E74A|nr:four helix bundle protein [Psychrilyobacter atlanticus]